MVFNAIFAYYYGYVGLAMATALSALINMALLYRGLHRQNVYRITKKTIGFVIRLVVAVAAMVAVLQWQLQDMQQWLSWGLSERILTLMVLIGLGGVTYLVALLILGIRPKDVKAATD
ncbi:proposed peptidoglycan lipid II flippase MurJ [Vibrio variabilis]|uniref:Proposed peptidoglycan lipid II flippase MurJ n=1 Tax=Vibrio variabilis TaxID=990271 RepID=A0ABQ0J7U1_9VIBR|nr:proposed peptidoglycan lipid II flippase MurJ [Vibrio variabilis]